MRRPPRAFGEHDQRGFTLVELILAFTIMALIIVPLTEATMFFLKHGEDAAAQYEDNNALRLINTYFSRDVASAASVDVAGAGCDAGAGDALVMSLVWTEAGVAKRASWFANTTGGEASLVRKRCTAGSPDETNTLAPLASAGSVWFAVVGGNSTPTTVKLGFTGANGLAATVTATPRWATSSAVAVPGPPAGASAVAANASAVVSWLAPATDGGSPVTSYTATASPGGASCTVSAPTATCTIPGLTNGTLYAVSVTATNEQGTGAAAMASVVAGTWPGAPTAVSATPASTQITVSWTAPTEDGGYPITSYTVSAYPSATCTALAPSTTCALTGLTPGTTYTITVVATNSLGSGPSSTPIDSVFAIAPGAPTGVSAGTAGVATTHAGSGTAAFADGTGAAAAFNQPRGTAVDTAGNVYVADTANNRIRKITSAGVVTTLAGSGTAAFADGTGAAASFNAPSGVTVSGSTVYVADTGNNRIRRVTEGGVVTTLAGSGTAAFADGTGVAASFNAPWGVSVFGTNVYVGDTGNNRIRRVTTAGVVTTLAGSASSGFADGTGAAAVFSQPAGMATDSAGNIFVIDHAWGYVRRVTAAGVVTTIAGNSGTSGAVDGTGSAASFATPYALAVDGAGNIYVADTASNRIRKVTSAGVVTTMTGSGSAAFADGTGEGASFNAPTGIAVDRWANLYVGDTSNQRIRKVTFGSGQGTVRWVAPSTDGGAAITNYTATASPGGATCNASGGLLCTVSGLTNGTAYTFTVTASNYVGPSSASVASPSFTPRVVPDAPTSPIATSGNTSVAMAWTASASNGGSAITTYTVTATPGSATCATATTGCTVTGLTNGTAYTFTVSATNVVGIGPSSSSVVATPATVPGAPTNARAGTAGVVTTFAGSSAGDVDATGVAARFSGPSGLIADAAGNVYVADQGNQRIRKITPAGVVTTFAGGTAGYLDATGTAARFSGPGGIGIDSAGNLYVGEYGNHRIRKITPAGVVTTLAGSGVAGFADGIGTAAQFNRPSGVKVDSSGNVYVGDYNNNRVRKITPAGVVTTLAGSGAEGFADGTGVAAIFRHPDGLGIDSSDNIYVADTGNNRVRKITPAGVTTTFAGTGAGGAVDGPVASATFSTPDGVGVDAAGNVYVADWSNHKVRKISTGGIVSTLAGSGTAGSADGTGTAAQFYYPGDVQVDAFGHIFVADYSNHRVRAIAAGSGQANVSFTAPASTGGAAITSYLVTSSPGTFTTNCTATPPLTMCTVPTLTNGTAYTFTVTATNSVGTGAASAASNSFTPFAVPGAPTGVMAGHAGVATLLAGSGTASFADGTGAAASFNLPHGVATDASGDVYVADTSNNRIRKVTPAGVVTTLAGQATAGFADGTGAAAQFDGPNRVAVDSSGNVYVADSGNNRIRIVTPAGVVTTLAGQATAGFADGTGAGAQFSSPAGVAVDSSGNVYVGDSGNNRIRMVTPAGVVTTLAGQATAGFADGTGASAQFSSPAGVAVDSSANVYVADFGNNRIRMVTPAGVVTTFAGSGSAAFADGSGVAASFKNPWGVAVDTFGKVYVADASSHRIRMITSAGVVTTLAGTGSAAYTNGTGAAAAFSMPADVAVDAAGSIYVADYANNRIRSISVPALGKAVVSFTAPASTGGAAITGYTVTANPGGATCASTITAMSCTVSGLAGGTTYSFTATATNSEGISVDSAASNSYAALDVPGAPTSVMVGTAGAVTLFAGSGLPGWVDATGAAASFNTPKGIAVDSSGNAYVADTTNHRIRKITPAGVVTTLAGSGVAGFNDATGAAAQFNSPSEVAVDASGNVWVADTTNNRIRKITPAGVVTTLAGSGAVGSANGTGGAATFSGPSGVALDSLGNLFVADSANNMIRKIVISTAVVTTFAGQTTAGWLDATGTSARFNYPTGVTVDAANYVYIGDALNGRVRKISSAGVVTTLAGSGSFGYADGTGTAAVFNMPWGVSVDASGNVYVADSLNFRVRKITSTGVVTTLAGSGVGGVDDATGTAASFGQLMDVATDGSGGLYVADYGTSLIRRITMVTGTAVVSFTAPASNGGATITTYAATAVPVAPGPPGPSCTATVSATGTSCTISGLATGSAYTVTVTATNVYGTGAASAASASFTPATVPGAPTTVMAGSAGVVTLLAGSGTATFANGTGAAAAFNQPAGVATDSAGNVYVADSVNNRIRKVTAAGVTTTLAGSGVAGFNDATGTAAQFSQPLAVAVDSSGNVYVGDYGNHRVRKITAAGVTTTLAGSGVAGFNDATGTAAQFNGPDGVAVDGSGNVYVADVANNRIRKITAAGVVTTFAGQATGGYADGTGAAAQFLLPTGVALDTSANVYVADQSNHRIRKITSAAVVTTLAGSGTAAYADGTGTAASFSFPTSLAVDASGNLYVSDAANHRIRKITSAGVVTTFAGSGVAGYANATGTAAIFNAPNGVAVDGTGKIYIGDLTNHRIRAINSIATGSAVVSFIAPASNGYATITSYTVTASPGGLTCTATVTVTLTSCTVTGLTSTTAYTFTATATNFMGVGAASAASSSFTAP